MRRPTKILVVVQRYGVEVVGGSESHARLVAERLSQRHEVEVATTTALDYWTWAPHFAPGVETINGVTVRRFPVASGRSADFKDAESQVFLGPHTLQDEYDWVRKQGPHAPELFEFLHRHAPDYAAIVFYTYIYEPTVFGLPLVPERSILVSTAHDEYALRIAPYRALFHLPRAIGYLTPEERALVHRTFRNEQVPSEVLGVALDPPPSHDGAAFRARHGLDGRVALYLGQVSEGKGVGDLLALWSEARPDATLLLAGEVRMDLPDDPRIRALGRVSDQDKWDALAAADLLILPSKFESLGIVLLEAWQAGTPVLVPAANAVTAGQVARSRGGWTYRDAGGLSAALAKADPATGERGRAWVVRECDPAAFDARVARLIAQVAPWL